MEHARTVVADMSLAVGPLHLHDHLPHIERLTLRTRRADSHDGQPDAGEPGQPYHNQPIRIGMAFHP